MRRGATLQVRAGRAIRLHQGHGATGRGGEGGELRVEDGGSRVAEDVKGRGVVRLDGVRGWAHVLPHPYPLPPGEGTAV